MILEIEGKRVEVDDSFGKLSPEQQTAQVNEIAKSFAPAQKAAATEANQVNPLLPTIGGALAAEALGPSINKSSQAFMETQKLIKSGWNPKDAADFVRGKFGAVENWTRQMHGGEFFGGRDMPQANRMAMQTKYPLGIPPNSTVGVPLTAPEIVPKGPTPGAIPQSFEAASKAAPISRAAASPTLQSLKAAGAAGLGGVVPAVIGRGLAGAGAGFQGADAYNRLQQGDVAGGVISGLGAIGSAASMIPHPVTRVGGTVVGMGAEALNAYLDSLKSKPAGMANGGQVQVNMAPNKPGMPQQQSSLTYALPFAHGGLAYIK
jgi:hypothetical protein